MPLNVLKIKSKSRTDDEQAPALKFTTNDALRAASSVASAVASISDMASFPPTRAAASLVLVILETVQQMDNNRTSCYKLARRAARILVELKGRMEGRWEGAPKALVDSVASFEATLIQIRDFMQELSKIRWMGRLLQKAAIENALNDFHDLLDEAERRFHMASLIEIHYTVGILEKRSNGIEANFVEPCLTNEVKLIDAVPAKCEDVADLVSDQSSELTLAEPVEVNESAKAEEMQMVKVGQVESAEKVEEDLDVQLERELAELDSLGFKQYHQSDVHLKSRTKGVDSSDKSFWAGTAKAEVCGQKVLVKRYQASSDSIAARRWLHDVKTLKNLYHTNLPQLVGYSDPSAANPFILLAHMKMHDTNKYLLNALQTMSIADCASAAVKMYRDITSVALYIQQQLGLNERETQVFVDEASYSVDASNGKVIVGIPPPQSALTFKGFGYKLTESLVGIILKNLPGSLSKSDADEDETPLQEKLRHVRAMALALLPKEGEEPSLAPFLHNLLEDSDSDSDSDSDCDDETDKNNLRIIKQRTLKDLRNANITAGAHNFAWSESVHNYSTRFTVGDFGYIPRAKEDSKGKGKCQSRFERFVKLGNIYDGSGGETLKLEKGPDVLREATGMNGQWVNGFYQRADTYSMPVPGEIECWPTSLSPQGEMEINVRHTARVSSVNDAWDLLVRGARNMASQVSDREIIEPHRIVLVTKVTEGQIYRIRDFSPVPFHHHHVHRSPFGIPNPSFGFNAGNAHHPQFHHQMQAPRMLYLFTSHRKDYTPFWSDNPSSFSLPEDRRGILRNVSQSCAWAKPEMYIDYIQLSEEDFD